MITIAEVALVLKAGTDFDVPNMPWINKVGIAAYLTVYVVVSVLLLRKSRKAQTAAEPKKDI